jgi:inorganic triphosphatase YgiF
MLEQELKFAVPAASRKEIDAQLAATAGATRTHLRAIYFDTADRQLGRRKAAIRLRQEGRVWVQTFKMAGEDALSRVELNHPCPKRQLDLSVYAGTPAEAVFAGLTSELLVRYETDVWRRAARVRTRGAVVEIAYDTGLARASGLELPLHELEFELVSGRVDALFKLADRWMARHGLVLDLRSKAERGDGLATAAGHIGAASLDARPAVREEQIARFWSARFADRIVLDRYATPEEGLDAVTAECFDQIARNATLLASIDAMPGGGGNASEQVHQLRVGVRRLRSAWKLFEGYTALPPAALQEEARKHFGEFGAVRDQDVMGGSLLPALLKAGMPPLTEETSASADPADLAAAPGFQRWVLALMAWSVGVRPEVEAVAEEPTPAVASPVVEGATEAGLQWLVDVAQPVSMHPPHLGDVLAPRLRKWHRKLVREGRQFGSLEDESRHTLRKLGKRVRYALSFVESLYGPRRVRAYRKHLSYLQDLLGEINDLVVAREHYTEIKEQHPQAWFALGWIANRLDDLIKQAEDAFRELGDTKSVWK